MIDVPWLTAYGKQETGKAWWQEQLAAVTLLDWWKTLLVKKIDFLALVEA